MQPIWRRLLFTLLVLTGLGWIYIRSNRSGAATEGHILTVQIGSPAPDFSLATPTGETYTLSKLRGKAVVINIWATWCPPCCAEMPVIEEYYHGYKERGFIVLGVNSTAQDNPLDIVPFVKEYSLTFPILLDETNSMGAKYNLRSLPSSYFINRNGTIAEIVIGGPMSETQLQTNIEEILRSEQN